MNKNTVIKGRLVAILLTAVLLIQIMSVMGGTVYGQGVSVVVNNTPVSFPSGADAYLDGGHTMIPLRALTEAMGATVFWFEDENRVQITRYDKTLSVTMGLSQMSEYAIVNGVPEFVCNYDLPVPAIQHGRDRSYSVYVPLRAIVEAMDAYVLWNDAQHTAYVHSYKDLRWYNVVDISDIAESGTDFLFKTTGKIIMLEGIPYLWDGENLDEKIQITNVGDSVWMDLFEGRIFSSAEVEISGVTALGDSGEVVIPIKRSSTTLKLLDEPIFDRTPWPTLSPTSAVVNGDLLNLSFTIGYWNNDGEAEFQVRNDMTYRYQYIFENEDMETVTVNKNRIFGTVGCNVSALNEEYKTALVKVYAEQRGKIISEPSLIEWKIKRIEEQRQIIIRMPDYREVVVAY